MFDFPTSLDVRLDRLPPRSFPDERDLRLPLILLAFLTSCMLPALLGLINLVSQFTLSTVVRDVA